ncbi:hypothetical protein DPV79_21410 [Burkholderia reimsis]|uniref:Uncharacterized protein n=1 Tax=Burkholderia reimsis TaxID=2234132 RepID=A0A365QSB5_9BURK|nr:hypothetical protein DPV79_21410 [Burkholderia reimsis]
MRPPGGCALWLATVATLTALALSILAGWQRGGSLSERVVWVAIGTVLVTSAHLLPALLRDTPVPVRGIGTLLWGACLATACYGHAVFFVTAQQHAGELRASAVPNVEVTASGRSLTVIMADRTSVTRQLAFTQTQRCSRDCPGLATRRVTLAAKLDALNAEADDVRRSEAERDRASTRRDALLADPVTSRLASSLGVSTARVDLLSGLAFAAVLEGVACLLWTVALRPASLPALLPAAVPAVTAPEVTPLPEAVTAVTRVSQPAVMAVTANRASEAVSCETVTESHAVTTGSHAARDDPVTPLPKTASGDDDLSGLVRDIAAGRVRPTVADIRRHLSCSQARATALRRQLAGVAPTA